MNKTKNHIKPTLQIWMVWFILAGCFIPLNLQSQDAIQFMATGPSVVQSGEYFRVSYTVNAKADEFNGPKINDFEFNGPMLSTSMSTQIINGKVSQTASYSYNYTMVGAKPGKFTLDPATVRVGGKIYKSNSLTIEVVQANNNSKTQGAAGQNPSAGQNTGTIRDQDLYARVEVDKKSVYKGQQIQATIKIYTRVNLARFGEIKLPSFSGFWSQEIPTSEQITLQRENVNGTPYNVGIIKRSVIVPQQSGEITIDPFEIECFVNIPRQRNRSVFDDFFMDDFFGSYQTVSKKISSQPITIQVKPLPSPISEGFTGGVGQLAISSSVDKTSVAANEAITFKVTVSGNGNLKLIDLPKIDFPAGLDVYDPKVTNNFQAGGEGISGSKTFEYLMIPRMAGDFNIPVIPVSWFDPSSGQYKNTEIGGFRLNVTGSGSDQTIISGSGTTREDVQVVGQDIQFIKTDRSVFRPLGKLLWGSKFFWGFILTALLLFIAVLIAGLDHQRKHADPVSLKARRAASKSRIALKKARKLFSSGHKKDTLDALLTLTWNYMGDRLSIDKSDLNIDSVSRALYSMGIDEGLVNRVTAFIDNCQYYKYAPGIEESDYEKLLDEAGALLSSLDKQISK